MSLYDSIANSLSTKSLTTAIANGTDSALSGIKGGISSALGGGTFGNAVANIGGSAARNAAVGVVNKYVPMSMQKSLSTATGALGDVLSGDFNNAGLRLLDSGLLDNILPGMTGVGSQARFMMTPTPLFGGISPDEARKIYEEMRGNKYCRKNLWLLEVSSQLTGDASGWFNMFATDLDYSPLTITGEKRKIGASHVDMVNSSDPIEIRITTFDDTSGFIKSWFREHCQQCAATDGTVGLPANYAIKIKIVHGFLTDASNQGGYEDIGLFRPGNLDVTLSRKEDGLEELQMTFVQLDTFMAV